MRTRTKRMSAIGTAVGLVLMASAVTPAAGAPQPAAFTATGCSSFKGATTTGSTASFSDVALRRGDKITISVAPAAVGDTIFLSGSFNGFNLIFAEGPASGFTFEPLVDGYYNFQLSLKTASAPTTGLTWSFNATCSTTSVAPSPSPSPSATTKPGKGGGKKP